MFVLSWTDDDLRAAVAASYSIAAVCRALGIRAAGGNHRSIKRHIARLGLDTSHFDPWRDLRPARAAVPLQDVMVEHSAYNRGHLKRRLLAEGLLPRSCQLCGQGEEWHGRSMSLILDHINGVHDDNRLENLRIVCPNCDATLETHCGRRFRVVRPERVCELCSATYAPKSEGQRFCSRECGTRRPRPQARVATRPPLDELRARIDVEGYAWIRGELGDVGQRGAQVVPFGGGGATPQARKGVRRVASTHVSAPVVVVMAAGKGTRMRSKTPKVLHDLCGRPMVAWPIAAALAAGAQKVVVVDGPDRNLAEHLPDGVVHAVQPVADGTGGSVLAAAEHLDPQAPVVVLSGDVPLVRAEAIAELVAAHTDAGAAATMATTVLDDATGYGRVVRDAQGAFDRVVETKTEGDATPEQLEIREINTGIFVFDGAALLEALPRIGTDNAQGEKYLPEALPLIRAAGGAILAHVVQDPDLVLGVNDLVDLERVRTIAQWRIQEGLMREGVTIVDPASTYVDVDVTLGRDTRVEPFCVLKGTTSSGEDCVIGPSSTLIDTTLGAGTTVVHTYATEATVHDGVSVGPFAYLRPGTVLRDGSKVGTFVEIKNSDIGPGAKVPHLSYIGDADVGEKSNLGAGTITANYDGTNKHRTTIGKRVKGSVDTSFVAPVTVGDDAWTAAGSVITKDIPPGALGVARARQTNIDGFSDRQDDR